ncbi:hypothetical protein MTYM_01900 [Methylococcales bacterium]|nr:hypothetical protein MTYM_01900 [Methylococcales bacterium]
MKMLKLMRNFCGIGILIYAVAACTAEPDPQTNSKEVTAMEEQAKRRAPKPVEPVAIGNIRYEVIRGAKSRGFAQNGGVIAAVDIAKDEELWTLVVYRTEYDLNEERDVQEIYITKLTPSQDKSMLRVENEAQKSYMVNLTTREVTEIAD